MATQVIKYECDYCKTIYDSEIGANECFADHNIICLIEEAYCDHDCWGSSTREWRQNTSIVFKNPQSVHKYMEEHHVNKTDYRIIYAQLI